MLPYVPVADRVRVGVTMFSLKGALTFGLASDYAKSADLSVLVDGISSSMVELRATARQTG